MATVLDKTVQALADVSGVIVDRTVTPEKVIGQAWIISKSRMVVLASSVANYADAPWALLVKFPYPDLVFSVKAVSLHPEFNRRAARDHYLAQTSELIPPPLMLENDIATITIEAEIPDLQPDRVQELNRALSLPLTISAQDLSGVMRAGDTGNILQKAIGSQRNGVLNFYDERKVPFCRILIKGGRIIKASFQNLQNEFAVCELMWRKPGGNFVLQSGDSLNWSAIPEITMSTEQLAAEASRRTNDLPRMLDALGGPNVRYTRTRQNIDLSQINQQIRWVVERVWPVLDGALPLSKMSERLSIDTYTAMQAIWDMKHHGLVAMANFEQYHRSGQLGPALTPGHDVDLKFWDTLQGFFLDELSTAPVTIQGNFFGSYHLLSQSTLLHTMPVQNKYGAIILKDGRLVGLHNGKFTAPMQNPPPFPLNQMSWIGSLSDMSARRMRTATAEIDHDPTEDLPMGSGRGTMTGIKVRSAAATTLNAASASDPNLPPSEQIPASMLPVVSNEPEVLQKFSKIQMGAGGGAIGLFLGMVLACCTMAPKATVPPPAKSPTTAATPDSTTSANSGTGTSTGTDPNQKPAPSGDVFKATLRTAGFKDVAMAPFAFTDTSKDTAPKPSFGMESERANQKVIFVVWPNTNVAEAVDSNTTQPPFLPLKNYNYSRTVAQGTSPVNNMYWKATRYLNSENKETIAFVGAYPSTLSDRSILVVAEPLKNEGDLDFKNTVNLCERMHLDPVAVSSGNTGTSTVEATEEDIQAYIQKVGAIIKGAYKAPPDSDRANKSTVKFIIDSGGNINKLELKYSSGMDEVDKALQKAVLSKKPFPAPPNAKDGQIPMQVTLGADGEMTFDEP